jgi:predicted methyltransferase
MYSRRFALAAAAAFAAVRPALAQAPAPSPAAPPQGASDDDPALVAVLDGTQRSAANKARDRWRHPLQSLEFWGLAPGLTVIDVDPGGGYWTEILGPYLSAGGGRYLAAIPDKTAEAAARTAYAAKYADQAVYGPIGFIGLGPDGLAAPEGSADMVLLTRYIHDLITPHGTLDRALISIRAALRPGGVLAVEQHRADPRPMVPDATDGYVSEAFVIAAAQKAGLALAARSEINANPKDSKDHPFGVWTLPPTRRSAPQGQPPDPAFDHTKYDAIGESDRMTLRFVKPG